MTAWLYILLLMAAVVALAILAAVVIVVVALFGGTAALAFLVGRKKRPAAKPVELPPAVEEVPPPVAVAPANVDEATPFGRAVRMLQKGHSAEEIGASLAANGLDAEAIGVVIGSLPARPSGPPPAPTTGKRTPTVAVAPDRATWGGFIGVSLLGVLGTLVWSVLCSSLLYLGLHQLQVPAGCGGPSKGVQALAYVGVAGYLATPLIGGCLAGLLHVVLRKRPKRWIAAWGIAYAVPVYGLILIAFEAFNWSLDALGHAFR